MAGKRVFLTAVMAERNGKRVWTGIYACSICGQHFRPDLTYPSKLSREFETHRDQHAVTTEIDADQGLDAGARSTSKKSST